MTDLSHLTKIDVVDVAAAVDGDKLTDADVFKRTYLGHGAQSSVFVFQGHAGPFRKHVHTDHDEIGYVLAGDVAAKDGTDHVAIRDLEMLKGLPGVANTDTHLVPVIRNTPREPELVSQLEAAFADPRFRSARAVVVRDHGAYIWGDDVLAAKRHTEVYHFLFEALVARRGHHMEDRT